MENGKLYIGAPFGEVGAPICMSNHCMGLADSGMEISLWDGMTRGNSYGRFYARESRFQDDMGRIPLPGQVRLDAFHHFACGALSIEYTGAIPKRIVKELTELKQEITPISSRILGVQKVSRIGILACDDTEKLRMLYDAFYCLNLQTDMLPATRRDFGAYDYLVVYKLPSENDDLAFALRSFVDGGGHLFALCGNTEAQCMNPGLTDVFGLNWEEWTNPEELTIEPLNAVPAERMELLQLTTAVPVLRYQGPGWGYRTAMSMNRFGKGCAVYLGCLVFEDFTKILMKLLNEWCIPIPQNRFPVVQKRGFNALGKTVTFLLNYSAQAQTVNAPGSGVELLSRKTIMEGQPLKLEPFGVMILEGKH